MSFFPKEHGAYGQMIFPLVTSMLVSGVSVGSLFFAIAVVAGFLVHEPLLVILGFRGPRARREQGQAARWWVAGLVVVLVLAGIAALRWMEPAQRFYVVFPAVPAVYLFMAAATGKGKSIGAEVAVAIAFSLVAIPLCLLGGSGVTRHADVGSRPGPAVGTGIVVAMAFVTNFVLATLAVRVVIAKVRGGGDPRMVATMRAWVYGLAIAIVAAAAGVASGGWLPWLPLVALVPGMVTAFWIAAFPPPPAKLRAVGWALVTTSAIVALLLIVTLRAVPLSA